MSPRMVGHSLDSQLMKALERALALINAYAQELNSKDGGNRRVYQTVAEWLDASV